MASKIKLEDLVVLQFTDLKYLGIELIDILYVREPSFKIESGFRTWSYLSQKNIQIGNSRILVDDEGKHLREKIIGVYNKTNLMHLNIMLLDIIKYTNPENISKNRYSKD